jgi:hypothetical protein
MHRRKCMTHPLAILLLAVSLSLFGTSTAGAQTNDRESPQPTAHTLVEALRGEADPPDDSPQSGRVDPDRPHLPEASTAVGKGHVLLEGGYRCVAGCHG